MSDQTTAPSAPHDASPEAVLAFWRDEVGPTGWYRADPAVDAEIERRFGSASDAAIGGAFAAWEPNAASCLALLILLDQFPRNRFRDDPRAFAGDPRGARVAGGAVDAGLDLEIDPPLRQFFYLPFTHSERAVDQDRGVALIAARLPDGAETLRHAEAHRDVIRRFGRFPHRNAILGRASSEAETAFLASGGYNPGARPVDNG